MLMPIVSMNRMSMNESVAAACCYKQVAAITNVFWDTLNGGWIGSGYVEEHGWIANMNMGWTKFGVDYPGIVAGGMMDSRASGVSIISTVNATTGNQSYTVSGYESVAAFFSDVEITNTSSVACSHTNDACAYRLWDIVYRNNYHFESKTAHKLTDWALPHPATQFAS